MDKLIDQKNRASQKKRGGGFFLQIKESIKSFCDGAREDGRQLIFDLLLFCVGFLLSRCHLIMGARPLGLAFVSVLPMGVWPALGGVIIGSLSLGLEGIIFASSAVAITLLRAAVSAPDRRTGEKGELFSESLILRLSISVLGGFAVSVYEVLMLKLSEATLLFGLVMIIVTPIAAFALSGLFSTGISLKGLISGSDNILKSSSDDRDERYNKIFFQISALTLIFFISLSFKNVNILGISLSYVFGSAVTLLVAKRFGGLRAMAVGFISALPISGVLSVSFALAGLCAGVMFGFGTGYAIIAGGVALCAFSAYSSGMSGLLSSLPEYAISCALTLPMLKKVPETVDSEPTPQEPPRTAEDMVGTMALAYQNRYTGSLDSLESTLTNLSKVINEHTRPTVSLTLEEYRSIIIAVAESKCIGCADGMLCARENIRPSIKNAEKLAKMLWEGKKIFAKDLNSDTEFCQMAHILAEEINHEASRREQESYLLTGITGAAEDYELISGLISRARLNDDLERTVDDSMTEALTEAFQSCGFTNGTIRAFGNRRKHFILAGEDESGVKISSFELRKSIEKTAGVRLGTPEYFRKGKMVLMECDIRPRFKVSIATASSAGKTNEISGDTAISFETENDYFYSLISDGMGSGDVAKETSSFASDFIKNAMEIGTAKENLILMLNHSIRARREECSATIDLFELDLLNGNGMFLKSGAAPSYIKRESSIFRIRSQTAPIGLLRSIDTEKINVEIKAGDHIFMMSDGIADATEDAPWLLLLLGDPPKKSLSEYAQYILNEAKKNSNTQDDMSITVIKVEEI